MIKGKSIILRICLSVIVIIKLNLAKKHLAIMTSKKKTITITAMPGDIVEYQCPYDFPDLNENELHLDSEYIRDDNLCFNYVTAHGIKLGIREYLRGIYNLVKKKEDDIYYGEFVVPPIVLPNKMFECYCYTKVDNKMFKSILKVNIKRSKISQIPGCDFNTEYRDRYSITTQKSSINNKLQVCNVNAYVNDYIGLLCPTDYVIKPDDCFNNVYMLKDGVKIENEADIRVNPEAKNDINPLLSNINNYDVVKIDKILKMNIQSFGDAQYRYAKIPDIKEKVSFTCMCNSTTYRDKYIMNVSLDLKENKGRENYDANIKTIRSSTISIKSNTSKSVETNKNKITPPSYSYIEFLSCSLMLFFCLIYLF